MKKKPYAILTTLALFAAIVAPAASAQAATTGSKATASADVSITATPTVPVILFPGIGGSQLHGTTNYYNVDDNGDGSDIVWVDKFADHPTFDLLVNDEALRYNLTLKHAASGHVTDVVPANSNVSIWSPTDNYGLRSIGYLDADSWFFTSYMDPMINTLKANGYVEGKTLFGFPQDWRQDYAKHFNAITATINQALAASGASKVAIVAHSQGGMLMKTYLLAHPEMESKIDRFITMGTPFLGAAKAAKATSSKLGGYDFGVSLVENFTGFEIAKYSPAVYHLAPSLAYEQQMFSRYGRATINSYNSPSNVPTTPAQGYAQLRAFEHDPSLFDYSTTQHSAWDNTAPNVPMFHLISDTVGTDVGYNYTYCSTCTDPNQLEFVVKAGDGTVPLISAEQPGSTAGQKFFVHAGVTGAPVSHTGMVSDTNVISKVLSILQGNPNAAVAGIDSTPNRSLDAAAFTAYSLSGATEQFDADIQVTNGKTGQVETIKFKQGKSEDTNALGESTGLIIRTSQLGKDQFNVQLIAPANGQFNIEVTSNQDTDIALRSYDMDAKGVTKRESFGKLKQQAKSQLKIEHGQGKHKIARDGKALQSTQE